MWLRKLYNLLPRRRWRRAAPAAADLWVLNSEKDGDGNITWGGPKKIANPVATAALALGKRVLVPNRSPADWRGGPLPRVYAWSLTQPMLLVPAHTGIIYRNQTRGHDCNQREETGFLLPLMTLGADGFNDWHDELCSQDMTPAVADMIDAWLKGCGGTDWLLVDRDRLELSEEGWVYVKAVDEPQGIETNGAITLGTMILVWKNCD